MQKQQVAEYELYKRLKLLGEGAFGKAYLVECLQDNSQWVTKYMDLNSMAKQEKDETIKEAKILELLNHPNIVKFKEVYQTKKGKLCIVMEYADGGDLAKRIKDAKNQFFTEVQILDWFTQICLAMKHVHERKILHRDLKGQNIFLTKENRVKLGDFGIAKVLGKTMDKAKTMVGTPYYLSPEIIESKPYSFKSDIWSLGAVLYELCSLKPPFNADSLHFLALKIVRGQYNPIPGQYSKELKNLVGMMLQVDSNRRPTIQEILKQPIILTRIKGLLTESIRQNEFSHTMLHNKVFKPESGFNNIKQVLNELPCPPQLLPQRSSQQSTPQIQKDPQILLIQQEAKKNIKPQQPQQTPPQSQQQNNQQPPSQPMKPPIIAMTPSSQQRPDIRNVQQQRPQQQPQQIVQNQHPARNQSPQRTPQQIQLQYQQQQQQSQQQQLQQQQQQQQLQQQQQQQQQQLQQQRKPPVQIQKPQIPNNNQVGGGQIINLVIDKKVQQSKPQSRPSIQNKKQALIVDDATKKREEEERQRYLKLKQEKDNKMKEEGKKRLDNEKRQLQKKQTEKDDLKSKREEQSKFMREDLAKRRQQKGGPFENIEEEQKAQQDDLEEYNSDPEQQSTKSTKIVDTEPELQEYTSDYEDDEKQTDEGIKYDPEDQVKEEDAYIKELLELIENANNAVKGLPFVEDQKFFDNITFILDQPLINRDDDIEELSFKTKDKNNDNDDRQTEMRKLSKEEDDSLVYLNDPKECLRLTLIDVLSEKLFEKACTILKQYTEYFYSRQIEQFDLEQIEKKHQSSNYKTLFPFLDESLIKRYLPLLFIYIVE